MPLKPVSGEIKSQEINDNFSYLDSTIRNIDKGSPRGVYNTLAELKSAFPTGNSNIYVVLEDGNWYFWNGNSWVVGGKYQSRGIANKSITPTEVSFVNTGKNLFDKNTRTQSHYVRADSGGLTPNESYDASDFVLVQPNTTYVRTSEHQLAFYDDGKQYISGTSGTKTFTTPSNAFFVRVTVPKELVDIFQIELGNTETLYEPFKYSLSTGVYAEPDNDSLDELKFMDSSVTPIKTSFLKPMKNLFNKETRTAGYYVNENTGKLIASMNYDVSDYIPINPNTTYTRTTNHQMAFYDKYKNFIVMPTQGITFTTPSIAKFIRVTVPKELVESYQVELGKTQTLYESFRYGFVSTPETPIEFKRIDIPSEDIVCWFSADDLNLSDGEGVKEWKDKSLNGHDIYAPKNENSPIFRNGKYNGLPTVEFTRNGEVTGELGSKRLITKQTRKIFSGSKGATLFFVAEKFNTIEYPISIYEVPFMVSLGVSNAFIRSRVMDKFEIAARRTANESLSTLSPKGVGLINARYNISLYEAHIDFEKGECTLYQDGLVVASGDFTSRGLTDMDFESNIAVGDVVSPPTQEKTGFSGNISEIILYRNLKSEKEINELRKYLMEKWDIEPLDGRYYAKYSTVTFNEGITSSNKSLSLIGIKKDINFDSKRYEMVGYLYLDESAQKVYYSAGRHDSPNYLFDWNQSLTGEPCQNYIPSISQNGDIIFLKIRSRGNPIIYPSGDYTNPVVIDFTGEDAPMAGLMDTGMEWDYDNNFLLNAEYWNPAKSGEYQYVWKVEAPFTNKSNWRIVFRQITQMEATPIVEGSIRHFHTLKRDFYTGAWYANTGDQDYQCKTFESRDKGETWQQVGGGSQADRMLGLIFLEDGAYWGTDSHADHGFYKAPRKSDGYLDFKNYKRLAWLSMFQPTYQTVYLDNPKGFLFLDRAEERLDYMLDVTFWSLERNRLYRLDIINAVKGNTGEQDGRFGFGNQAVTTYQPQQTSGIICGATSNWMSRPMTLKLLGNSLNRRINNVKIDVMEKE